MKDQPCYSYLVTAGRSFFLPQKPEKTVFFDRNLCCQNQKIRNKRTEGYVVRTRITLACTECKQRNYNTMKEKKNMPDRFEIKKYCRFCKKHTLHRETK